jgi:hypothetical protein
VVVSYLGDIQLRWNSQPHPRGATFVKSLEKEQQKPGGDRGMEARVAEGGKVQFAASDVGRRHVVVAAAVQSDARSDLLNVERMNGTAAHEHVGAAAVYCSLPCSSNLYTMDLTTGSTARQSESTAQTTWQSN